MLDLEVGQKYLKPPRMIQYRLGKEKGRKASNLCCILQVCLQDLRPVSSKRLERYGLQTQLGPTDLFFLPVVTVIRLGKEKG